MKRTLIFAFGLVLTACSPKVYDALKAGDRSIDFTWEAYGCLSDCPQYEARISEGRLYFTGLRGTSFEGDTSLAGFESLEMELIQKLEEVKYLELDSIYQLGGSTYDGPSYAYKLDVLKPQSQESTYLKKVKTFGNAPEGLQSMQKWLNQQLVTAGLL